MAVQLLRWLINGCFSVFLTQLSAVHERNIGVSQYQHTHHHRCYIAIDILNYTFDMCLTIGIAFIIIIIIIIIMIIIIIILTTPPQDAARLEALVRALEDRVWPRCRSSLYISIYIQYICVNACAHVLAHICICTYLYTYICIYAYNCTHTYTQTHISIYRYIYIYR